MAAKVVGVIPARLDSKRFHGKVLFKYRGKPLIQHLYEELLRSKVINSVIIATDNAKIKEAAQNFGAKVVMTPKNMKTGSDRVAFVAKSVKGDIFVNIQGDAIVLNSRKLDSAITKFVKEPKNEFGTLARKISNDTELFDNNAVKAVLNKSSYAAWFSRQPIPYMRHFAKSQWSRQTAYYYHIGIYFFRRQALLKYASWKQTNCEKAESLEQLRILENGKNIKVYLTNMRTVSIDSPRDIRKLKEVLPS